MKQRDDKHVGYRIKLYPNKEQIKTFRKYFGASRFIYNWSKTRYEEYYEEAKEKDYKYKTMTIFDFSNEITKLRNSEKYSWLKEYDTWSLRYICKDLVHGYESFFRKTCDRPPKYKSKKNANQQFPIRNERLSIFKDCVRLPSIGYVSANNVPDKLIGYGNSGIYENKTGPSNIKFIGMHHIKYVNSRVIFDGCYYYLTFNIDESDDICLSSQERFIRNEVWKHRPSSDIIGIDVGCKEDNWIILSNGRRYSRPNQSKEDKKIAGLKKQQARQRRVNDKKVNTNNKKTNCYSKRQEKVNYRINKNFKKITNRKKNEIYRCINDILKEKPEAVGMETIKVKDMYISKSDRPELSNDAIESFNKQIQDSMLYAMMSMIENTLTRNGISVYHVAHDYPSTKLCSNCGYKYDDIGSKRVFRCPNCGTVIDRDLNASINISNETKRIHYSGKYGNIA